MSKTDFHTTDNDDRIIFFDDDAPISNHKDTEEETIISLEKSNDKEGQRLPPPPEEEEEDDSKLIYNYNLDEDFDFSPNTEPSVSSSSPKIGKWLWTIFGILATSMLCAALYCSWQLYNFYYNIGVPISIKPDENIAKLAKPYPKGGKPDIVLTSDSILGVALNMYELRNLQAEITLTEPDTTDTSVWMYSRCADQTSDNQYLGSLVINGKELSSDVTRLGYCAMANGNVVIGISRSDKVKDYVVEHKGSYFRQFILLSNGVLPTHFLLHGKVERRALARMTDDRLYYIETRHPETLWDFADALREYGFADAIYITGGNSHSFYRTNDGKPHSIGNDTIHTNNKYKNVVPWIVFKAR